MALLSFADKYVNGAQFRLWRVIEACRYHFSYFVINILFYWMLVIHSRFFYLFCNVFD